jgi:hypothetical protein
MIAALLGSEPLLEPVLNGSEVVTVNAGPELDEACRTNRRWNQNYGGTHLVDSGFFRIAYREVGVDAELWPVLD